MSKLHVKLQGGNARKVRELNKEIIDTELARLTAEYEERVFGDGDFPDEEMRGYRTRIRTLRNAQANHQNSSRTFTED